MGQQQNCCCGREDACGGRCPQLSGPEPPLSDEGFRQVLDARNPCLLRAFLRRLVQQGGGAASWLKHPKAAYSKLGKAGCICYKYVEL
ncbi:Pnck [Symbiodinium microadriaticum]|nr:Pnck [Symbiodinium microadriaticum]